MDTVRRWIGAVVFGGSWGFEDAEGVVQEILLKLLQIVREERVERAAGFKKFVHTVARYDCVKQLHRERRRTQRELPEVAPEDIAADADPHADLERGERTELLRFVVHGLPDSCRQLWKSVYVERRAAADLAQELGITLNNLRVRVHRCLEKARALYRNASGLSLFDEPEGS